jgi:hypothetical protein
VAKVYRSGQAAAVKDLSRDVKRPCKCAPAKPENAYITYDQLGRHRNHRFRGIWGCDEVTEDADGITVKPDGYNWRIREVNAAGADQWNGKYPSGSLPNREGDPFLAREAIRGHGFHHGHYYESSWQAYNANGVSEWSDWSPKTQFLETVQPLAPTITLFDVDQHKDRVEWTNPTDPGNVLIHHKDTLENIIQIATGSGFSNIVLHATVKAGLDGHHVFKHTKPGGATWYCRVGAKTQGGLIEWSPTVTGSKVLPPTPTTLTSGDVSFKDGAREYVRAHVDFTYGGSYDDDDIKAAVLEYQYETGNPVNGDDVHGPVIKHFQPGDSITGHWIIKKLRPGRKLRLRWAVKDTKGHQSAFTAWSSVITVTDPASLPSLAGLAIDVDQHKIEIGCTDPDDPNFTGQRHEAVRVFHFQVWRGAVTSGTLVYEATRLKHPTKVFKIRKPGTDTFSFRARPVGYDGGFGSWAGTVTGTVATPPTPATLVSGDVTYKHGGKHETTALVAFTYAGSYTDDNIVAAGLEWQHEPHSLSGSDDWNGPRTKRFKPGDTVTGAWRLEKLKPGWKLKLRWFVKDSKSHQSAYSTVSAELTVPTQKTPGAATSVKVKAGRDSAAVTFEWPTAWSDASTEDFGPDQVERAKVTLLKSDGTTVCTYPDTGTQLVRESKSNTVHFPLLDDTGAKVLGRPFKAKVEVIGHGEVTAAAGTAATGTNPIDTTTATVGSDGSAPASSPTPTLIGGPTFIYFKWDPLTNPDSVTYEVHMSTSSGFTPGAGTKLADVTGTGFVAKKTAVGADLAYGTTYYGKLIAKDVDGSAAASSQGSASMVQIATIDVAANAITGTEISNGAISTPKLNANVITANEIAAGAVIAGKIAANAITSAEIVAGTIVASDIAAGTITADRLNITTLSAITADLGTVTAGTITGATIKTSSGTTRWEMTSGSADTLVGYYSGTLTGSVAVTGAGLQLTGYGTGMGINILASGIWIGSSVGSSKVGFFAAPPIVQPAVGGGAATFVANSDTAVNKASTFDGYTIGMVVRALRNLGLLS